jgi:hypothetical protein
MKSDAITPSIVTVLASGIALALATGACSNGPGPAQAAALEQLVESYELSPKDWLVQNEAGRWKRGHVEWGKPRLHFTSDSKGCTISLIQLSNLYRSNALQDTFATRAEAEAADKLDPLMETISARYELQASGWVRVGGDECHPFVPGNYRHAPAEFDAPPQSTPPDAADSGQ